MAEITVGFSADTPQGIVDSLSRFTNHIVSNWVIPGLSTSNLTWTLQSNSDSRLVDLVVNHNGHKLLSLSLDRISQIDNSEFASTFREASLKYGSSDRA